MTKRTRIEFEKSTFERDSSDDSEPNPDGTKIDSYGALLYPTAAFIEERQRARRTRIEKERGCKDQFARNSALCNPAGVITRKLNVLIDRLAGDSNEDPHEKEKILQFKRDMSYRFSDRLVDGRIRWDEATAELKECWDKYEEEPGAQKQDQSSHFRSNGCF